MITSIDQLDLNKCYTYADYLTWQFEERVELIKGKIFKMSPAPRRAHQEILGDLHLHIGSLFQNKRCRVYIAPFDVRLFKTSKADKQVETVVQPDLCIFCDTDKLDERGAIGAPDLIVEVLSPSTSAKDTKDKFQLYEENGVKEYWMVYTAEQLIHVFNLVSGKYQLDKIYTRTDTIVSKTIPELSVPLTAVFTT